MRVSFYCSVGHAHATDAAWQRKKEFTPHFCGDTLAIPLRLSRLTPSSALRNGVQLPGSLLEAANGWENLHFRAGCQSARSLNKGNRESGN